MAVIALVGCGKTQLSVGASACDLYTGNLFRAARAYAERCADQWFILSAKYGVVSPGKFLEPHDARMQDLTKIERELWDLSVRRDLRRVVGPKDRVVFLAGSDFESAVDGVSNVERPLAGMGVGERLHWLKVNAG